MRKSIAILKKPQGLLVLSLVLVLLGSLFAGMLNTSFYSVDVKKIKFQADHGTLSGLLYMPEGAGAEDPRPVIITTHGYLNSKEMQDAPAIEMSRRGYIVLALDMYDHGDSRWSGDIKVGEQFSTFWIYSQFDAAKFIYGQEYTKKDDKGNAYIAVSGHSMGGFSSFIALYMDEMTSLQTGYRMIYTGISVGSDFSYASAVAPQDQFQAAFGDRTVGMIAGHYDEFFFNKSDEEKSAKEKKVKGTVTHKDFVETASGRAFLGLAADDASAMEAKFFTADSGELKDKDTVLRQSQTGERIIFTPNQTHPWNHFSTTTTSHLIDFYAHAFDGVTSPNQKNVDLGSGHQIWWLKEACNFIAMIGFFLFIVPFISLLIKLPFFNKSVIERLEAVAAPTTTWQKTAFWISIVFCSLIPAILYPTLMDKQAGGLDTLSVISIVLLAAGIVTSAVGFVLSGSKKSEPEKSSAMRNLGFGGAVLTMVSLLMWMLFANAKHILTLSKIFNEPTTNQVGYWALASALIMAFVTIGFYYFNKKQAGTRFEQYGISRTPVTILSSLCTAVVTVVVAYLILFGIQAMFGTDFRIWTFAVRTFQGEFMITALRYMPFFLIYYFVNAVALNANTRDRKGGYALAILLNVGGLVLWLIAQYGKDFMTGTSLYPAQALNSILLFALIPCLALAAVYARKVYEKTNNVWLASFLNTMLFTMITVANTVMFWNLV
ncbi:hypothetical protein GNP92_08340 [Paenibacillus timonensis]|nr:alpha/beta hydrolase [Paenibacillus timonensis]MUG86367.1 hypothetical protein [Paenibacillus timonensis]